ncbi:EamA family transporter [Microbacterium sp. 179-I 3D3 NHS]|uniref:EamA family transporter n=1 Tax=Microbacterium sp. 179-I 3D3 NHS TaxID=3142382 RepID=UPI0039A28E43
MSEATSVLPVLLALCAAVGYGASDFIGGVTSRSDRVWAVAATSQATATAVALPVALATLTLPRPSDLGWAVLAGMGAGAGNLLIYHGLATGRMMVVAPLAAVVSTVLPVTVDVVGGRHLSALLTAGVVAAVIAGWLVSGGGVRMPGRTDRAGVVVGLLAGAGFGMQFAALGQVPAESGFTPVGISQAISVVLIISVAGARRARWIPGRSVTALGAAAAGGLAGGATLLFQVSAQVGSLTVAVVLTSLYPAVTVALGVCLLRERATRVQLVGLVFAAAAIVLIRLG